MCRDGLPQRCRHHRCPFRCKFPTLGHTPVIYCWLYHPHKIRCISSWKGQIYTIYICVYIYIDTHTHIYIYNAYIAPSDFWYSSRSSGLKQPTASTQAAANCASPAGGQHSAQAQQGIGGWEPPQLNEQFTSLQPSQWMLGRLLSISTSRPTS